MKNTLTSIVLTVLMAVVLFSCGYKTTKSGLEYRVVSNGNGKQIAENDFVSFNMTQYLGDSVIFNSYDKQPIEIEITKAMLTSNQPYNFFDLFTFAHVGDSIIARIPMDSFFTKNPQQAKPNNYKKGTYMKAILTIISTANAKEKAKTSEKDFAEKLAQAITESKTQRPTIDSFVAANKLTGNYNEYGVFVAILKQGNGVIIAKDTLVQMRYTGKLLNGTKFDSNNAKPRMPTLDFNAGARQLIPGVSFGVLGLTKGSKAILVIPSSLAYGKQGAGGAIGADAILEFEITL